VILIALGGAIPRLSQLGSVPPALHPDEMGTAADASAFFAAPALTYAHERGGTVEGVYVALAAVPLALAKNTGWLSLEAAARLPAALAGCLLILAVAWAGRELTRSWQVAVGAAICLALQPWAWHFSHLALRGTLTPLFVTVGLAAWLRAERSQRALRWGVLGGAALALAALTYPPLRVQVPLLALMIWFTRPREGQERSQILARRWALGLALAGSVILIPWTLAGAGAERLEAVWAWEAEAGLGRNLGRLGKGYVRHFGTRFLFSGSSSRGFAPEGVGLIPRWQGVLLILGILACLFRRRRQEWLLLGLVLLFPLAAAPTRDVPNAMRAVLGIPALALLAGRGWQALAYLLREGRREGLRGAALMFVLAACLGLGAGTTAVHKGRLYFEAYPQREAAFYFPGRRALAERALQLHREGRASSSREPFLEASLRLYAPGLPARREGKRWVMGAGSPVVRLSLSKQGRLRERAFASPAAGD